MADWDEPQNPTATERADAKAYQGRIADLERQIAELRAERDEAMEELGKVIMACPMSPETRTSPVSVGVRKLRDNWEAAKAENARLTTEGTRKAAECERLKRERLHAGKLQSQYAGRLRRATDQANALGAALDIERARALAPKPSPQKTHG